MLFINLPAVEVECCSRAAAQFRRYAASLELFWIKLTGFREMATDFEIISQITDVETIAIGRSIRELPELRARFGPGRWRKRPTKQKPEKP